LSEAVNGLFALQAIIHTSAKGNESLLACKRGSKMWYNRSPNDAGTFIYLVRCFCLSKIVPPAIHQVKLSPSITI